MKIAEAPPSPPALSDRSHLEELSVEVSDAASLIARITREMGRVVIGQHYLIRRLLIGLLSDGHVLLEGVPGLAKTTTIKALANCVQGEFRRIQFTPDLLPSDVVGTVIYNSDSREYFAKKGPIFANIILADEINRAPAKVQSAMLQAMQEHEVTLGEETHPLPNPFLVLATQNPIEQEGTYPLPEAQVDRFMLKVSVDYGTLEEEIDIMEMMGTSGPKPSTENVIDLDTVLSLRALCSRIHVARELKDYMARLVLATRNPASVDPSLEGLIRYGASPRASINLVLASRAHAFIEGRAYVTPFDVRSIALDVLRHRLLRTYEAEAEEITSEQLVLRILEKVDVP